MLLHPHEQRPEQAAGHAAVDALAGGAGEALFDLVDPQDDRGHDLGLAQSIAESPL